MDEAQRMYIAIILDRSGSMKYSRAATIRGFNEQADKIRKEAEKTNVETYVSFYTFNQNVEPHYHNTSINFLQDMTDEEYVCVGDTAMYDAVGQAISELKRNTDTNNKNNSYVVIVVSDGRENKSKKWTRAALADEIKACQDSGLWTFTYLGANQDLSKVADQLNIPKGNVAAYAADMEGTKSAWASNRSSIGKLFRAKAGGQSQVSNFYGDDDKITDLTQSDSTVKSNTDDSNRAKAIWRKAK